MDFLYIHVCCIYIYINKEEGGRDRRFGIVLFRIEETPLFENNRLAIRKRIYCC